MYICVYIYIYIYIYVALCMDDKTSIANLPEWTGGIEKGGMKLQRPSVQN